jgi:hypothetical protein
MNFFKTILFLAILMFGVQTAQAQSNKFSATNAADITDTTATVIKDGTAGVKYAVTLVIVSNLHASIDTRVDILSGSTVILHCPAAHGGGGCVVPFPLEDPLYSVVAESLYCQAATTGAKVRCTIKGQVKKP